MKRLIPLARITPPAQVGALAALVNICMILTAQFAVAEPASVPVRIVAFGDSLTAGYQLQPGQAFPVRLETALKKRGHNVEVLNAGVSGDTTAAGLERFDWAVPDGTDAVILELGANDALRGQDPKQACANLEKIIGRLKARNMDVLLAGMNAPRNWGPEYAASFDAIYPDLAAKHGILLYPFFLDGIALDRTLNLGDGMHPNPKGVDIIVERIMPKVEELIARVSARKGPGPKT